MPCAISGRDVIEIWYSVHKCSARKGGTINASKSFVCRGCIDQPDGMARTSVNIDEGASLELVNNFCYLGDMLSVDGYADAAMEARV